jgi:hypothetical protein
MSALIATMQPGASLHTQAQRGGRSRPSFFISRQSAVI